MTQPLELAAVFTVALMSSAHCVGMCGGFVAAVGSTEAAFGSTLARQITYSAGRVFTYLFLGAVGGFVGLYLSRFDTALVKAQQAFSLVAGAMMILIGVSTLGVFRLRGPLVEGLTALAIPVFRHFLRGRAGLFLAGLANGFLPCGLVYAFLATAIATGDMFEGMLIMGAFGAGTVPAMVVTGCGSSLLSRAGRMRVYRLAAVFIIVAGVATILRAVPTGADDSCHGHARSWPPRALYDRARCCSVVESARSRGLKPAAQSYRRIAHGYLARKET